MGTQEVSKQNFSGGELSDKMDARTDLAAHGNGCRRVKNFITTPQGPAVYRGGWERGYYTRGNKIANVLPFEYNDEQAYDLEFTDQKMRVWKDEALVLETAKVITGITAADPPVVTIATHGYSDGDLVYIDTVDGMTEVNGKYYIVANKNPNDFELTDIDGNNIDASGYTAYSANGTAGKVYELDTPYTEANDLFQLDYDQKADLMYIAHKYYLPRKLTRTGHASWTLTLQTRTNDPLTSQDTITGITQADPGVVTATGHSLSDGDIALIETVVGMTEVNGQPYIVANSTANTFELTDLDGNNVDTSGYTAYSSAGWASNQNLNCRAVAIYESRLWYGGPSVDKSKVFSSKSPDSAGDNQYDVFTTGTSADDGVQFALDVSGPTAIFRLAKTDRLLLAITQGGNIKITGADDETAITPTSVKARTLDLIGSQDVKPLVKEGFIMYVERGGLTVKSMKFETLRDNFVPRDENLIAEHITQGNGDWSKAYADASQTGIKQMAWETGRPDCAWAVRNDGLLMGYTYKPDEGVGGWHRHTTGASGEDKFIAVFSHPRPNGFSKVGVVIESVIGANTRRSVCFRADTPIHPKREDYFTGEANETADTTKYELAMWESQKSYVHLDQSLTYDGSSFGIAASASVTPGATTGSSITFTASAAVFLSAHVGREIWKRSIDGVGTGRATIVTFTNTTTVVCDIKAGADFDSTDAMPAGDWYLTTNSISNMDHLEGRTCGLCVDGGTEPDQAVSSGAITLVDQRSVVHAGLKYEGFLQPMVLEIGGETGTTVGKIKNVNHFGIRFRNSAGCEIGTDLYKPEVVPFTSTPLLVGNPKLLQSTVKRVWYPDSWEEDKVAYVRQNNPLPCEVQQLAFYGDAEES